MFSALHELLVDHFAGIIRARLDMNGFFDYSISSAAQRLSSPILIGDSINVQRAVVVIAILTWQGTV